MYIKRAIQEEMVNELETGKKGIVLYGACQVGKTTLAQRIIKKPALKTLKINADIEPHTEVLSSRDLSKITSFVAGYELLFIDEAQRIPNIGINLKIIIDNIPNLRVMATGSLFFELANRIQESMVGRVWKHVLYPISVGELRKKHPTAFELNSKLEELLIFGSYPQVITLPNNTDKIKYLDC